MEKVRRLGKLAAAWLASEPKPEPEESPQAAERTEPEQQQGGRPPMSWAEIGAWDAPPPPPP
eukprot:COSAG01_NODE_27593_length_681_cov_7.135739_2_plen_61_part_01